MQDRSLPNHTNECAWVTVPASSPALRAPESGLRDLTRTAATDRALQVMLRLFGCHQENREDHNVSYLTRTLI